MSVIVLLFIIFLSVIGLCDILESIKLLLLRDKKQKNKIICCMLKNEASEISLRYIIEEYKWSGKFLADKIVVVNYLKDSKVAVRCKELAEYFGFDFIEEEMLLSYLNMEN